MRRPWLSAAVSLALVLGAPGLPAYQAAAQLIGARAAQPVSNAAGWTQALGALSSALETQPQAAPPSLLRTLGQLRLELVFSPKAAGALSLVKHIRAEDPAAFSKLPVAEQAALAGAAIRAASEELAGPAEQFLAGATPGKLSAAERATLRSLESAWFYLPDETGRSIRLLARQERNAGALDFGKRVANALGAPREDKIGYLLTRETRYALKGAERLLLERPSAEHRVSERFVRDVLAPYAARALDNASARVAERGHSADDLWKDLFRSHEAAFGLVAPRRLISTLREAGVWTDFVSAVSVHAALRLAASPSPDAQEALREAGWRTQYQFRLPSWLPEAAVHPTFGAWLASRYGPPTEDPEKAFGRLVGTVFGIPVRVEPQSARLMAIMFGSFYVIMTAFFPGGGILTHAAQAALGAVLMQVGTILHELGHALAAKAFGEPVVALALTGKGGGAVFYSNMRKPFADFVVSAAGPVVTLVWALAFLAASGSPASWLTPVYTAQAFAGLFSLAVNLAPILPTDGGRMFRAALSKLFGDHYLATRVAAIAGAVIAASVALASIPAYHLLGLGPALGLAFIGLSFSRGSWKSRKHSGVRMIDEGPPTDGRRG